MQLLFFFLLNRILRFFIKNKKARHIVTLIGTFIITPIIYLGLIYALIFYISYEPKRDFDRDKWFSKKSERWKMVHDLIDTKFLIKRDTSWVKSYLGEPTSKNFKHWEYSLGSGGGGLGFKFHFLNLK